MSNDLVVINRLETTTQTKLEKVGVDDIISRNSGCVVDSDGTVIGLKLDLITLTDLSFLNNLTNLKQLTLRGNQVKDLSPLKNLKKLKYLEISDNNIAGNSSTLILPKKLSCLILRNDNITDISFLNKTKYLTELDLSHNKITDVSCIKSLSHLKRLHLGFNRIVTFPGEIAFLAKLEYLDLEGNTLSGIPDDVVRKGLEGIRDYFRNLPGGEWTDALVEPNENMVDNREMEPIVKRTKIFICYSRKDAVWRDRVQTSLSALANDTEGVDFWDDTRIKSGMEWKEETEKALNETKIAILLISTAFLASDFIKTKEIPPLLNAAREDGATILPLIIKPCRFSNSALKNFQAVNDPTSEPLSLLNEGEQDKILLNLSNRVAEIITSSG